VHRERVRVAELIEHAVEVCRPAAQARNVRIATSCDPSVSAFLDPTLIEQALVNLVDNAIKYSHPDGDVTVSCSVHGGRVVLAVRDRGIGIEARHLPRLFERFYRVDKARSRKLGGTGLGLAIVKHIAQVHGGAVRVESTPGKGSLFVIELPRGL